jgi:hypothetical protein
MTHPNDAPCTCRGEAHDECRTRYSDQYAAELTPADILSLRPVLCQGQADDLHWQNLIGQTQVRLWLSRTGLADGEPYENTVTVEHQERGHSGWHEVQCDGDSWASFEEALTEVVGDSWANYIASAIDLEVIES